MSLILGCKKALLCLSFLLTCCTAFANETLFQQAREFQRNGKYDNAIDAFKKYLSQPTENENLSDKQLSLFNDALVQLMNCFQSKGEPDACISALQEVYKVSPTLQNQCLRDYYSVLGSALSRTERMAEAEKTMLKALTLPLHQATPERYFRDYAYAAAVFYSNPNYQNEVINWCQEALNQADSCKNTSGKQWVTSMLGTLYKRNGHLNKALTLFQESKEEAKLKNDDLGVINSLQALVDLFLYWNTPEYANIYASEAIQIEKNMSAKNPMVSAQTYINKGRTLYQLGELDSVSIYTEEARKHCQSLPYNSGMVDVNLLHGTYLTEKGGNSLDLGIQELLQVTQKGTAINRAKAYHQLGQTYLKCDKDNIAEAMLDSMYILLHQNNATNYIHVDYNTILNHYLEKDNHTKVEQYVRMMLQEKQSLKERRLNYNLVECIVDLQTEHNQKELEILKLQKNNQRLLFIIYIAISVIVISIIVILFHKQKKRHIIQMEQADEKLSSLAHELKLSNAEKEINAQEINEILNDKDKRQELETLTPSTLLTDGESKFRQHFELLYPLFLPRLREKVPSITRREELLSMLIVLKQDNKRIAELLAIAPRSVLMLRHRFRQKIGMTTESALEGFIEEILGFPNISTVSSEAPSETSH